MEKTEEQLEAEKKAAEEAKRKAEERANELKSKSVEELVGMVLETSSEARDRRLRERELEKELEGLKNAQKAEKEAKLKEDGKLQELIDSKTQELTSLQTELERAKAEAEESKTFKAAQVEAYKAKLGDKWLDEYKNLSLIALEKLVNTILATQGKEINVDGGSNGEIAKIELTKEQKKIAKQMYPYYSQEEAETFYKENLIKTGKIKTEK